MTSRANGGGTALDRARTLFEFLRQAQLLRVTPIRSTQGYDRVLWLHDLPEHSAVMSAHRVGDPQPEDPILWVDRVPRDDPPAPGPTLEPWLSGRTDDPAEAPELVEGAPDAVGDAFKTWLDDWTGWAHVEKVRRPVRELYGALFQTFDAATNQPEEFELVLGVGCLSWHPADHEPVQRHLFVTPIALDMDDVTGRLTVTSAATSPALVAEVDMLDPYLVRNPQILTAVKADAAEFDRHPLQRDGIGDLSRRVVNLLDPDGAYVDEERPAAAGPAPIAAFAPALILRRRSQRGMLNIFDTICAQLATADEVPAGILPLVDPDYEVRHEPDLTPGGFVAVGTDTFLALPVNNQQLKILHSVDTRAQTVVQGPPGTGKTHTAAALLSHLLAQGKRVLVTAHTDRALQEVRHKLPAEIQPLSVAVVGASRSDLADLRLAVERIASKAAEHDERRSARDIEETLGRIDDLCRERAAIYTDLLRAREHEVTTHEQGHYTGTLAEIAQRCQVDAPMYEWLMAYLEGAPTGDAPLTNQEALEWLGLLRDGELARDEADSTARLVDLDALPRPESFAGSCAAEADAVAQAARFEKLRAHEAFAQIQRLEPDARATIQKRMTALADETVALEARDEAWLPAALADVRAGRWAIWQARAEELRKLIEPATALVGQLGPLTTVEVTGGRTEPLRLLAAHLRAHLASGGRIRTLPDGRPKLDLLTPKVVKQAAPLFDHVLVNGLPPVTDEQLAAFQTYVEADRFLTALAKAWPATITIPEEDTLQERLQWHVTELAQLDRVLELGKELRSAERHLADLGLNPPAWTDLESIRTYARLVDAAAATDAAEQAAGTIDNLAETLARETRWSDAGDCVHDLHRAVQRRNHCDYARAYGRLRRLLEVRSLAARRDHLAERLAVAAPALRDAVMATFADGTWTSRLQNFERAWIWAATLAWISQQQTADVNALQARIADIETRIRRQVERLAALRAWSHAVSPQRLTGRAKADLTQYVQLVNRLGQGTGKYAAQRRAEIRRAMERCRDAVPVWIMPIYRIAEQFQITENMFDVVIVDEASQAGVEASFLQYLAPKIVVIGDDKQVSPSAVGVDQRQLRSLANQHLADDRYKDSWQDPKRSLFDEALMRYGGRITLVEHRRCVPEIIGFSNQVVYEPDGVRLVPVRQYGADRLDPIKVVHVPDGYVRGSSGKQVNPAEADAIVDQIVKCLADPRYDGLTFGVISLLGDAQARHIEAKLLERVVPEEWKARDLRCGDAPDFQGSERDVMFLSMVAAAEPGKRLTALTMDTYVQRYNVAASRAKDQMWVFHSVPRAALHNRNDMRYRLLEYCYNVVDRRGEDDETIIKELAHENVRVDPFESLFEQRVFNRILERGYRVIPQFPTEGYRIDLVIVGAKGRLAVECDGDRWHGPDAYERDLARQRDLERCGWRFFRIRESAFYLDSASTLAELWSTLDSHDIRPVGWVEPTSKAAQPPPPPEVVLEPEPAAVEDDSATPPPAPHLPQPRPSLDDYAEFDASVVPPDTAKRAKLIEGLLAIVAVEGPIVGDRLLTVYVRAAGRHRVGKEVARTLNAAISAAVNQGRLVEDNPLRRKAISDRTYRLPDQPPVRIRALGPRRLDQVPARELADLLRQAAQIHGWADVDTLYRVVLDRLGLRRRTPNVVALLNSILEIARQEPVHSQP